METIRPAEGFPTMAIATELREKTEVAKPFIEPARQDAGIISSRAQQFLAQATALNLRSFVDPLLRPREGNIAVASSAVSEAVKVWRGGIRAERQIMMLLGDANFLPVSADNLRKAVEALERESENLNKGIWSKLTRRGRLNTVRQQLTMARGYLALYDRDLEPLVSQLRGVNGNVDTAVDAVVKRLDELAKDQKEEKPSDVEEEISKEEVLDELEEQWLEKLVVNPLKKAEDAFIAKKRQEGGYEDLDEAIDRGNFAQLSQEYIKYIKSRVDAQPRTVKEWEETSQQWGQEDSEEVTDSYGPIILGSVNKIHRTFMDLDLEDKYLEIAGRLTLYGENIRQVAQQGYWEPDDQLYDLRPRKAYVRWAKLVGNFHLPSSEWVMPELEEARWKSEGHLAKIARAVYALPKKGIDYGNDIRAIPAGDLTKLPSLDRWLILRDYLQDKGLVPQEKLDAFENTFILRMVNEVLIPGGYESWPGTDVTRILQKLSSPKALVPLLYYQTYISGAAGLYKAGHTNAAAQRSLEALLKKAEPTTIGTLDAPQFVKEALLTLKDIAGQPMGDEYGRSYLTVGLVARKFREAAQEIRDNYDNPKYKTWLVALLRGMKNSSQPFSQETYDVMLSFLDLDNSLSLQKEIIETLASRIHNREQLMINTRINPDFPLALDSLQKILGREDFRKSTESFAALHYIMTELQQAVIFEGYSDAEIAKIKMVYGSGFQTTVGIPSREEMALSHQWRDRLVEQLAGWMSDPQLPSAVRYITLQIFDLVSYDYPSATSDIAALYNNKDLAEKASTTPKIGQFYWGLNFLRNVNLHGYYECLTDLLLRRYLQFDDLTARDLIISAYTSNPQAQEGISKWLGGWDIDKYIEENPDKMQAIFDSLNEQIVSGPSDMAEATIKLFSDRTYFRHDRYVRDLLLSDLDKVPSERRRLLFKELVRMVRNEERWLGAAETMQPSQDLTGTPYEYIQKGGDEEYRNNREFGQETVRLVADKMWGFLNSTDITEQFWAVYTLNLYSEGGEKFREVVDRLLLATHDLEKVVPRATQILDKIRDRLSS